MQPDFQPKNTFCSQPSGLTMNLTCASLPTVPHIISGPPEPRTTGTGLSVSRLDLATSNPAITDSAGYPVLLVSDAQYDSETTQHCLPQVQQTAPTVRLLSRPRYVLPPDLATIPSHSAPSTSTSAVLNEVIGTYSSTFIQGGSSCTLADTLQSSTAYMLSSDFQASSSYQPATSFWFYATNVDGARIWWPFSRHDACQLEDVATKSNLIEFSRLSFVATRAMDSTAETKDEIVPVEGGRYDVFLGRRERRAVYWEEPVAEVRRATWFYRSPNENRVLPFSEQVCEQLEYQFSLAVERQSWNHQFELPTDDQRGGRDRYIFHSPQSMIRYRLQSPSGNISQVNFSQSATEDMFANLNANNIPSEFENRIFYVRRGLDDQLLAQLEDGEFHPVDHVYFVVHGIGTVYNLKGHGLVECVNSLRRTAHHIAKRHFPNHTGRAEFLPIMWHDALHSDATGVDEQLGRITLRSIPKLRQFANSTLMDILFYTSTKYCQVVLNCVAGTLQRLRTLFLSRNPDYTGGFSIIGHSLGAVIVFDLLAHQDQNTLQTVISDSKTHLPVSEKLLQKESPCIVENESAIYGNEEPKVQTSVDNYQTSLRRPSEFNQNDSPSSGAGCTYTLSVDGLRGILSAAGLTETQISQVLMSYLPGRSFGNWNPPIFSIQSTTNPCNSSVPFTGFGLPKVTYPQLGFQITAFFMLGSPLGLFLTARGIHEIHPDYQLPTCPSFYNIFHPFDPVAYRVESLIEPMFTSPAALIPHHKGRKRFHLQLRDDLARMGSDIKSKIFHSAQATWRTIHDFALSHRFLVPHFGAKSEANDNSADETNEITQLFSQCDTESADVDVLVSECANHFGSRLNRSRRIDFVLQEAPLESFSDYLFALGSHATYWESEDTALFLLTEVYSENSKSPDVFCPCSVHMPSTISTADRSEIPQGEGFEPSFPRLKSPWCSSICPSSQSPVASTCVLPVGASSIPVLQDTRFVDLANPSTQNLHPCNSRTVLDFKASVACTVHDSEGLKPTTFWPQIPADISTTTPIATSSNVAVASSEPSRQISQFVS